MVWMIAALERMGLHATHEEGTNGMSVYNMPSFFLVFVCLMLCECSLSICIDFTSDRLYRLMLSGFIGLCDACLGLHRIDGMDG